MTFSRALHDIGQAVEGIDDAAITAACAAIVRARVIVGYGCGREGLQVQGLVMRLHHLGLKVAMQGDMAAPPLGAGDLFLCSAGPGELSTVTALMQVARDAGADVLFLTAEPETPAARLATQRLVIPARTMASDQGPETGPETSTETGPENGAENGAANLLPMGSIYEGALFMLFEIMVLRLRDMLGETPAGMRARHTNME